jgi:O-antigen/teichoic acid export membrane protein
MAVYTRGRARRSLIDTVTFRALSQLATVASYIVMVRGMAKEDFGVFNLLYAFIPVISTVASLGLEQTLRRYQPEYLRAGNVAAANWLVRFIASTRFGTNVIMLAVILLTWNYTAPLFKLEPYRAQFAIFGVLVLFHFQSRILQLSLASHMLHKYSVGSTALLSIAKLIGYGALVHFHHLTLEYAIFVDIVAYALSFLGMRIAYHRHCRAEKSVPRWRPSPVERKRMFRYGFYNNFNDAGSLLLTSQSDNFFIAAFIDPVAVAIYAFYTRLRGMANNLLPVQLFENVVNPVFFGMPEKDAERRVPQYFSLLAGMNLLLQWPVFAFCLVYHPEIVQVVFGGKYIEHSWLLPLIMGFATVNSIAVPVTLVAQYEEKAGVMLLSKVFAIYNVIAIVALLPVAGLYGAAFATGSGQTLKNLFIWWHVRDRARWLNGASVLATGLGLWAAVAGVCYLFKVFAPAPPLVQLIFGAAMCGGGILLYLRSPAISASDRAILSSVLHGKEARIFRLLGLLAPVAPARAGQ